VTEKQKQPSTRDPKPRRRLRKQTASPAISEALGKETEELVKALLDAPEDSPERQRIVDQIYSLHGCRLKGRRVAVEPPILFYRFEERKRLQWDAFYFVWNTPTIGYIVDGSFLDCQGASSGVAVRLELKGEVKQSKLPESAGKNAAREFIPTSMHVSFGEFNPVLLAWWKRRKIHDIKWVTAMFKALYPMIASETDKPLDELFFGTQEGPLRFNVGPMLTSTQLHYLAINGMWACWEARDGGPLKIESRPGELETLGFAPSSKGNFSNIAKRAGLPIGVRERKRAHR